MPSGLPGDCLTKIAGSPGYGVLVYIVFDRSGRCALNLFGRAKVWKPLRKIHGAVLLGFASHFSNDGFGETSSLL